MSFGISKHQLIKSLKAAYELGKDSAANNTKQPIPHCCPVCNGSGLVPNGFYMQTINAGATSSSSPEKCRSCNATGIVWS
jgi:hypothetical protein